MMPQQLSHDIFRAPNGKFFNSACDKIQELSFHSEPRKVVFYSHNSHFPSCPPCGLVFMELKRRFYGVKLFYATQAFESYFRANYGRTCTPSLKYFAFYSSAKSERSEQCAVTR
jgi:hypothetical protein